MTMEIEYQKRLKQALEAMQKMRLRLDELENQRYEPIAVVGMGCRFPGGVDDPDSYWQLLHDGIDAVGEIPPERWLVADYFDADKEAPGKTYTRWGGFLDQIDQFDPHFFGIAPREVAAMDPQHRIFLEVAWEALERAGQAPDKLKGSRTGVFVGITLSEYMQLESQLVDKRDISGYHTSGSTPNVAAGRVSYLLGLQGPSIALDTACSSSLVAIHLACQSLRVRECDMTLAGGVNTLLIPDTYISFSKWGMMSADGRCKTFDASADGMVRSEGCGVVVLKRLSDALKNGDNVLAVIRGSAVNQDGASGGLSVPNGLAQAAVIREALANAGVEPDEISYVEAHGTGTSLGDPIEIEAISKALGKGRSPDHPLIVGSAKTNLGHLESASGVAGFIKAVLALQKREIPSNLHFHQPSPLVPWDMAPIEVPTKAVKWTGRNGRLLAGVSSFGFSGTNAHVILEAASVSAESAPSNPQRSYQILTLSAKHPEALRQLAVRYANFLAANPAAALDDVCFTANVGRTHFHHRLAVVADSGAALQGKLADFAAGDMPPGLIRSDVNSAVRPKPVFLFTGQGAQHVQMGRLLYETEPVFRETVQQCSELLTPYLEYPLLDILYPNHSPQFSSTQLDGLIDETTYTQPALFAIEYALAQLWRSWGIEPAVVMGHSVGEYVAACLAGVFSLEDGLKLIAARGRLMGDLPKNGSMVSVFADEAAVREAVAGYEEQVDIAAINGPTNIVISGEETAVAAIHTALKDKGITCRPLTVSHAFHSPLMDSILDEFAQVAATVTYHRPRLTLLSNVTGRPITGDEATTPAYWRRHVRAAVRFYESIQWLDQQNYKLFLEIGPNPTLSGMGKRCLPDGDHFWLPSLRQNKDDWQNLFGALAGLYGQGVAIDWEGVDQSRHCQRLPLPTYPFQRQSYWFKAGKKPRHMLSNGRFLPGQRLRSPLNDGVVFELALSTDSLPFVADHVIRGQALLPATAYVEMALAAGNEAFGQVVTAVSHLLIQRSLPLSDEPRQVQIILTPPEANTSTCRIFSFDAAADKWLLHAEGQLQLGGTDKAVPDSISLAALHAHCPREQSTTENYALLRQRGIEFGSTFQGVTRLWQGDNQALGEITWPPAIAAEAADYHLHPALLDAGLQLLAVALPDDGQTYIPVGIGQCHVYGRLPHYFYSHAVVIPTDSAKTIKGNVRLFDENGRLLVDITDITLHRLEDAARFAPIRPRTDWLVQVNWQSQPLPADVPIAPVDGSWLILADVPIAPVDGSWLILADAGGVGHSLYEQLQAAGAAVVLLDGDDEKVPHIIQQMLADKERPFRGIVHLSGCNPLPTGKLDTAALQQAQQRILGSVLALVQAVARGQAAQPPRLWLVTRGAQAVINGAPTSLATRPLWGMAQSIHQEHPDLRCTCIDLNAYPQVGERDTLWAEIQADGPEQQIALHNNGRFVARLVSYQPTLPETTAPVHLTMSKRGKLDDLALQSVSRRSPGPGEVEIRVHATGMNFRDVLKALDMYPEPEIVLGDECAGVVTAVGPNVTRFQPGDAVFGITTDSYSSYVVAKADLLAHKPPQLSFADAATLPIAFITAHYALHRRGQLQAGERVLIHAAAGGVGQAAVQLAQRAGAEVWATAGSPEKRDYLRQMGVNHVLDSRTLMFADEIIRQTNGQGVDIILNSLNGDFIERSMAALATNGRFLEMGRLDIWDADQVTAVRPQAVYHLIFPDYLYRDHAGVVQAILQDVVDGIEQGTLYPLPRQIFPLAQAQDAFRFMAQARHVGKIVVTQETEAAPQIAEQIRPDGAYLITGGFGGIGLHLARWLADQGACHLTLVGRRGAPASAQPLLAELAEMGVTVTSLAADISQAGDVACILQTIAEADIPLRGIFHSAGVNADGVLQQQEWANFERVLAPKLAGTWHLHSQTLAQPLDFFVLFSSVAALIGSAGQANYAAANAFLDGFAQWRQAAGLPALSINWGAWQNVGMTAVLSPQDVQRWQRQGMGVISAEQGMALLGQLPANGLAQIGVLPIHQDTFAPSAPFFIELVKAQRQAQATAVILSPSGPSQSLAEKLTDAPASKRPSLLLAHIREVVRRILGFDSGQLIPDQQPLGDMGMDSLMAVELRNALSDVVAVPLPATLMFDYPSVVALADYLKQYLPAMQQVETAVSADTPSIADQRTQAAADLDTLSDEEAESLLLAELDQLHKD